MTPWCATEVAAAPSTDTESAESVIQLNPILSQKWALGYAHVGVTIYFALFFTYLSHQSLFHTDLWGHVAYGEWMLSHRALPTEDPFAGDPAVSWPIIEQLVNDEFDICSCQEMLVDYTAGGVLLLETV